MTARLRPMLRAAAHALAVAAVGLLLLLPRSRYDWVRDVAPDIDPTGFEDGGSNRTLVLALLGGTALLLELVAIRTARDRGERRTAIALAAVVALAALFRAIG